MRVSVIIPVYNAEKYLSAAIDSALAQPETEEILLIEDGSTDNSYGICVEYAKDPRVRLLTHAGRRNRGASASRNLGIRNASMPFIAFLDADDTYKPRRFEIASRIFADHPDADGVHEMIGVRYYDPELQERHIRRAGSENTGICVAVSPDHLFRILAIGKYGHISLDGLVVKKQSLDNMALMDTALVMGEDSDFVLRLAATRKLFGGDPSRIVTLRGVHVQNSVFNNPNVMLYRKKYLQKCIDQQFYGSRDLLAQLHILTRRVGAGRFFAPFRRMGRMALPIKLIGIGGYLITRPKLLLLLISTGLRKTLPG